MSSSKTSSVSEMRGYLWENLEAEILAEFGQLHPLVQALDRIPFTTDHGWHVEGELGDMEDAPRLEPVKSTAAVKSLRELRRSKGLCLDCDTPRDPRSKVYCTTHRERDRARAEEKRKRAGKPVRGRYKERGMRKKLPDDRVGTTQKFTIIARSEDGNGVYELKGYVSTGEYPDGTLGEIFVKLGKPGATEALLDQWGIAASIALQHGAPVNELFSKHVGTRFEPSGAVLGMSDIARCTSVVDCIARWIISKYGET